MTDADELLQAIKDAEDKGDPELLDARRAAYLEEVSTGPVAAEMRYRLGLSTLFRKQDVAAAMDLFKQAAAEKGAPVAPEARVSYALCLVAKQKRQQAIFELRKLLPAGCEPSIHTAQALDFLSLLLRESGAQATDVLAVDVERKKHLELLAVKASDVVEKAHYWLRLAAAHADGGTPSDWALARARYDDVVKLGAAAGESAIQAARAALKTLPR